ncbi:MAG: Alpha-ribazole-5'-phosphate phosphatase [uncultured Nocardioides sp.]|uniref:Alpha-ribazole-5'-phosphate phosphatase n=1 Tax=uncultured Nocardioides sp. TaxID=198441 RepID=A0A6J4NBQ6_9ACTN|nr:MAG: Alpha-ribazole-5'-phosphate phosphatase [uncultured Nocardioides sp.]
MTRLLLVRHGETVWHSENRYAGSSDIELTAHGRRQAELLAEWAASAGLCAVWSSPLDRARQTAAPCATSAHLPHTVDERLRELDFGAAEGMTAPDMEQALPEALHAFREDPVAHHLPGGEDPLAAAQRFSACLEAVCAEHPDGRVLVVAHTTVIRLALCELMGLPLSNYRRIFPSIRNCALTEIQCRDEDVSLLQFNAPLPALSRTPAA